jgi:hypothetical protein
MRLTMILACFALACSSSGVSNTGTSTTSGLLTVEELCSRGPLVEAYAHPDCADAACGAPCEESFTDNDFACDGAGHCVAVLGESPSSNLEKEVCPPEPPGGSGGPLILLAPDPGCEDAFCGTVCQNADEPDETAVCTRDSKCWVLP